VAGPRGGTLERETTRSGATFLPFDLRQTSMPWTQESARARLTTFLDTQQSDLVHANSLAMSRLSGPVVHMLGQRSLGHVRDIVRISRQAVEDVNRHTRLLAVSEATRAYHVAQGMSAGRLHVQYNGVDLERFAPRAGTAYLHEELGLPAQAVLVGTIGQLILRKGLDLIPPILEPLSAKFPNVHWLIVGPEHSTKPETVAYVARIKERLCEVGLAERVHFVGAREDISQILNELTLLVHLARQEPLGRVLLEAAASGLPIVATDVGGTREVFPLPLDAALLVAPGDAAGLAEAAAALLQDEPRRSQLGSRARQRMVAAFDARDAAHGLLRHYQAVLASG
jgi:glycosyltransferase involved in cell wall biosynthesis